MRYAPKVEFCRGNGFTFKRITLVGHDGTKHSFAVQMPTQTWVRREERIQQLFRIFTGWDSSIFWMHPDDLTLPS